MGERFTPYLLPEESMSLIAKKMNGNMTRVVTPPARMDDDSDDRPRISKTPAPDDIRMVGVKYMTALTPHACTIQPLAFRNAKRFSLNALRRYLLKHLQGDASDKCTLYTRGGPSTHCNATLMSALARRVLHGSIHH